MKKSRAWCKIARTGKQLPVRSFQVVLGNDSHASSLLQLSSSDLHRNDFSARIVLYETSANDNFNFQIKQTSRLHRVFADRKQIGRRGSPSVWTFSQRNEQPIANPSTNIAHRSQCTSSRGGTSKGSVRESLANGRRERGISNLEERGRRIESSKGAHRKLH